MAKANVYKTVLLSAAITVVVNLAIAHVAAAHSAFTPALTVGEHEQGAVREVSLTTVVEKSADFDEERFKKIVQYLPRGMFPDISSVPYCKLGPENTCNPSSEVGSSTIDLTIDLDPSEGRTLVDRRAVATTYLESPVAGEVARLVTVSDELPGEVLSSTVALNDDASRLVVTADDLPQTVELDGQMLDMNIYRIRTVLNSRTVGGDIFIENPDLCDASNSVDASFTSYGEDGVGGTQDDKTVDDSVLYAVSNCDSVPYQYSYQLSSSSSTAGEATTLSTLLTAPPGHATTKQAIISFNAPMALNPGAGVTTCSESDIQNATCDLNSQLGTVEIVSDKVSEPLTGTAHMGPVVGDQIKAPIFIQGQFNFRIDATIGDNPSGGMSLAVPLPPITFNSARITLSKDGTGTLLNPFICGTYSISVALNSYSGKATDLQQPFSVDGCTRGGTLSELFELSSTLSPRKPNRYVDLRLKLNQDPKRDLSKLVFNLPRELKFSPAKSGRLKGKDLAFIQIWDERRSLGSSKLLLARVRKNGYILAPPKKERILEGLRAKLRARKSGGSEIVVSGLPKQEPTDLTLYLWGRRFKLYKTTKGSCLNKVKVELKAIQRDGGSRSATSDVKVNCPKDKGR